MVLKTEHTTGRLFALLQNQSPIFINYSGIVIYNDKKSRQFSRINGAGMANCWSVMLDTHKLKAPLELLGD